MNKKVPEIIPIYHITHLSNLPRIMEHKGLWCDTERISQGWPSVGIAHEELKKRRLKTPVPVSAQGVLGNYVPFYFCNRSPMLFSLNQGFVEGYEGSQEDIIYLVSSVNQVITKDSQWCFSDGHPVDALTSFYDSKDNLDQIDWSVISSWSWKNTETDTDKKRRKQAEFLVYKSFPLEWVEKIGVYSPTQKANVESILGKKLPVAVERKWYY